jgi:hypothetical protein
MILTDKVLRVANEALQRTGDWDAAVAAVSAAYPSLSIIDARRMVLATVRFDDKNWSMVRAIFKVRTKRTS